MKLLKVISDKTYKGKDGKEHNYVSYFLLSPNGKKVCINPNTIYDSDARIKLEMLITDVVDERNR